MLYGIIRTCSRMLLHCVRVYKTTVKTLTALKMMLMSEPGHDESEHTDDDDDNVHVYSA